MFHTCFLASLGTSSPGSFAGSPSSPLPGLDPADSLRQVRASSPGLVHLARLVFGLPDSSVRPIPFGRERSRCVGRERTRRHERLEWRLEDPGLVFESACGPIGIVLSCDGDHIGNMLGLFHFL